MRLPNEGAARFALALILFPALASCAAHNTVVSASGASAPSGPAADYPVVVGEPYKVGDKLYTPADTMNYDEVGTLAADGGTGVTGSHHTLPLPSYVEVTSLETGRTILVRLQRRGPMDGNAVVALSSAALTQLGATAGTPVRVRRVNPPEDERAALRAGHGAPLRMDTPASLVAVLKRKLSGGEPVALAPRSAPTIAAAGAPDAPSSPQPAGKAPANPSPLAVASEPVPASTPTAGAGSRAPKPPAPASASAQGEFVVQAATMSTMERAKKVAAAVGGSVTPAGRYFRVRTGPFSTRAQAQASLAKVRAAGYSDARIVTNG